MLMLRRLFWVVLFLGGCAFAQQVGDVLWYDNFNDDDPEALYEVGWFYYGESDGLVGSVVEQRDSSLYFQQGSFTMLAVTLAGTNGIYALELDENGDLTPDTKEELSRDDYSSANLEMTFKVNFINLTQSWFVATSRMIQDDDGTDSDPRESPAYLVYISPLEGAVGLAKVPDEQYALLDPTGYQWLAEMGGYAFEMDKFYWVKYYLYEGVFKVKVWEGEEADEPDAWLIETEDPDPRVGGHYTYFALLNPNPDATDEMMVDNVTVREVVEGTAVENEPENTPQVFALQQNYPNPFNPSTQILYDLTEMGEVQLDIYNQAGQWVKRLVSEIQTPGSYQVTWNGTDASGNTLPSGIYYARLQSQEQSQTIKMLMIK